MSNEPWPIIGTKAALDTYVTSIEALIERQEFERPLMSTREHHLALSQFDRLPVNPDTMGMYAQCLYNAVAAGHVDVYREHLPRLQARVETYERAMHDEARTRE